MQQSYAKIVFLDRDGTISIDKGYTSKPADMQIFPGSGKAISLLKQSGFKVIIVTNQSAIARGYASTEDVKATNLECEIQLKREDQKAAIDKVFFCPHSPEDDCNCRKPKTGMITKESDLGFNAQKSWMIGDKKSDLLFGLGLKIPKEQCILVKTGEGTKELAKLNDSSFTIMENLQLACEYIVNKEGES